MLRPASRYVHIYVPKAKFRHVYIFSTALPPALLNTASSLRPAGDFYDWKADTITFYLGQQYTGTARMENRVDKVFLFLMGRQHFVA